MRNETRFWTTAALGFAVASCSPQRDAQHAVPENQPPAEANGRDSLPQSKDDALQHPMPQVGVAGASSAQNDAQAAQSDEPDAATRAQPTPQAGIMEICAKIARRAHEKCNQQVAGLYQSSCAHYAQKSGSCDEQILQALECQYKAADDLFCAHGADHNCSQVNRALKICQRGTAPEQQVTTEDDRTLPPGWEQIEDTQLGFSVAMPHAAALEPNSKRRTWKGEEGGIVYYVAAIDPPTGKLNNQAFVRSVVGYVGGKCQLHLKLNGELEFKGTTVVQYHSACPDKTEWHGMLHFWNGKAVSTGYHAAPGVVGVREPFFYSFLSAK